MRPPHSTLCLSVSRCQLSSASQMMNALPDYIISQWLPHFSMQIGPRLQTIQIIQGKTNTNAKCQWIHAEPCAHDHSARRRLHIPKINQTSLALLIKYDSFHLGSITLCVQCAAAKRLVYGRCAKCGWEG